MTEVYKDVKGYEGLYQVSNFGNVKSLEKTITRKNGLKYFVKERVLKPGMGGVGYFTVSLRKNNKPKTFNIHRLVAESFISNPKGKIDVNHIDGDKTNNRLENLEWATRSENNRHAIHTGLRKTVKGCNHGQSKLAETGVCYVRENPKGLTTKQLAEELGVSQKTIWNIINNKTYTETIYYK